MDRLTTPQRSPSHDMTMGDGALTFLSPRRSLKSWAFHLRRPCRNMRVRCRIVSLCRGCDAPHSRAGTHALAQKKSVRGRTGIVHTGGITMRPVMTPTADRDGRFAQGRYTVAQYCGLFSSFGELDDVGCYPPRLVPQRPAYSHLHLPGLKRVYLPELARTPNCICES
jgi:hypothetical protein